MSNREIVATNQASICITEQGVSIDAKSINLFSAQSPTDKEIIIKDGSVSIYSNPTSPEVDKNIEQ